MRVQRSFAERIETMVNTTKLTQIQQNELNGKLISAATNGDISNVRELLVKGADVGATSNRGWTALHYAACNGHVDVAKVLIENGADVGAKSNFNETSLHKAALNGHVDVAKFLIEKGADVDAKSNFNETSLHKAAFYGHVEVAKVLIEKGADVGAKDKNNETAVEIAIKCGYHQIAELIENSKKICSNNVDPEKENKIDGKNIDILSMDMDELVRMADESAKKLCRKG